MQAQIELGLSFDIKNHDNALESPFVRIEQ
jgi:hypothetical protein